MGMGFFLKKSVPVSVIIPCYNASETLERAIISVIKQSVLPKEIIVVDDNSTDDSWDKMKCLQNRYKQITNFIVKKNEKNIGAGSTRNRAWDEAKYDYIAFLDADDAWIEQKIEVQYGLMKEDERIDASCHKMSYGDSYNCKKDYKWCYVNRYCALFKNPMMTPSVMLKRNIHHRFKDNKRYAEDTWLWCELLFDGKQVVYIDDCLAKVFKPFYGASGLSGNMIEMEIGEMENFWWLYKSKKIPFLLMMIVCFFSILKFIRRIIKVYIMAIIRKVIIKDC